jgi:hypothetical protein
MSNQFSFKALQKYAWIVLLVVSALALLIGLGDFILAGNGDPALVESMVGTPWAEIMATDPHLANLVDLLSRILGAWLIGFSVLASSISVTAFRKGDRWAWYALWALPLTFALIFAAFLTAGRVAGAPAPPALFSAPGLFLLSVLGLMLPFRQFIPRRG